MPTKKSTAETQPPFNLVIPARYGSTRLPGKVLMPLAGRPMLAHVYERALESGAAQIVVATDDTRVAEAARGFGAEVCLTRPEHATGTDRIAEVVQHYDWPDQALVVNLQGDEPLMPPALLRQVAADLAAHPQAVVATLGVPVSSIEELFDPNLVKVVCDKQQRAMYFSRAVIPWDRDAFAGMAGGADGRRSGTLPASSPYLRHLGLYAYRAGFLRRYSTLAPCECERREALEQLRVLWHGYSIHVGVTSTHPGHGVDTPADAARVEALLNEASMKD